MSKRAQLEDRITSLIADVGNDELCSAWLEWQQERTAALSQFCDRIERRDTVAIGATIGAIFGHVVGSIIEDTRTEMSPDSNKIQ